MYSFKDIKEKIKKDRNPSHDIVFYFGTKFSIYFSWLFINLGLSPNFITGVFFLIGLIGALMILTSIPYNPLIIIVSYILWRLHMIIDLCDGEVARYTQSFSINGAYWDFMIHSILYPLYFINICIVQFYRFDQIIYLFIGIFGSLIVSLMFAVKNNYFRAMFANNYSLSEYKEKTKNKNIKSLKNRFFVYFSDLFGFEGFLILFCVIQFLDAIFIKYFLLSYTFLFFGIAISKLILLSVKGYYPKKN